MMMMMMKKTKNIMKKRENHGKSPIFKPDQASKTLSKSQDLDLLKTRKMYKKSSRKRQKDGCHVACEDDAKKAILVLPRIKVSRLHSSKIKPELRKIKKNI